MKIGKELKLTMPGKGVFHAVVSDARTSPNELKPHIIIRLDILRDGIPVETLCFDRLFFGGAASPAATNRSLRSLVAIGIADSVENLPEDFDPQDLIDKDVWVVMDAQDYLGLPQYQPVFNGYHRTREAANTVATKLNLPNAT